MDWTPFLHAALAMLCQAAFGLLLGDWITGAVLGCCWFVAREHTQAEYRWIAEYGQGQRAHLPWWGGFDPRAWTLGSVLDCAAPVLACAALGLYLALVWKGS